MAVSSMPTSRRTPSRVNNGQLCRPTHHRPSGPAAVSTGAGSLRHPRGRLLRHVDGGRLERTARCPRDGTPVLGIQLRVHNRTDVPHDGGVRHYQRGCRRHLHGRSSLGRSVARRLAIATALARAFAAICHSSTASAATLSATSVPAMLRANYEPRLAFGVVAISGTLGMLSIPPASARHGPVRTDRRRKSRPAVHRRRHPSVVVAFTIIGHGHGARGGWIPHAHRPPRYIAGPRNGGP